jgi:hypothetical protein
MEGGCEKGHRAGRWHMHEEPFHATAWQLAPFARAEASAVTAPDGLREAATRLVRWIDEGGQPGPWPNASGLNDLRAALGEELMTEPRTVLERAMRGGVTAPGARTWTYTPPECTCEDDADEHADGCPVSDIQPQFTIDASEKR